MAQALPLPRRMSWRRILAVAFVVVCVSSARGRAESLGTFKGPVKMSSSLSLPGIGLAKSAEMTIKLTRNGPDLHVETHVADALGRGQHLTVTGVGRILSSAPGVVEVSFGGAAYTQSIHQQLNQALTLVPAAKGLSIGVDQASGRTRLEIAGNTLKLQSSTSVVRGRIAGGFKARLLELSAPRQIETSFQGLLQRQP